MSLFDELVAPIQAELDELYAFIERGQRSRVHRALLVGFLLGAVGLAVFTWWWSERMEAADEPHPDESIQGPRRRGDHA